MGHEYKEQTLTLIRHEQRWSNFITTARVQPFC